MKGLLALPVPAFNSRHVHMFPLKTSYTIGYKHGDKTFYNASHVGVDLILQEMTPIYAPEDGVVNTFFGAQGGNWLSLQAKTRKHRFAHLKQYVAAKGQQVKEGNLIAYTGGKKGESYSGNSTTPHVHWDIELGGVYIDPLKILWDTVGMTCEDQLKQEKADHAESIKEKDLNHLKWQTELDSKKKEQERHRETLEKLQNCEDNLEELREKVRKRYILY